MSDPSGQRVLCPGPLCGEDITDFPADVQVFLKGDVRPYCSMECVMAKWRQMRGNSRS